MQNENEPKHTAEYDGENIRVVFKAVNVKKAVQSKKGKTLSVCLAYVNVEGVKPVKVDGKNWNLRIRAYVEYAPESQESNSERRTFEFD